MTPTYLLDANVLIALTVGDHEHHARASHWVARVDRFAVSPVVEGALVRFLVRVGESARAAQEVLRRVHELPRCSFWADAVSYAEVPLAHVQGHRQVTDAYLAALCVKHRGARLATLDEGLVEELPDVAVLVPVLGP